MDYKQSGVRRGVICFESDMNASPRVLEIILDWNLYGCYFLFMYQMTLVLKKNSRQVTMKS